MFWSFGLFPNKKNHVQLHEAEQYLWPLPPLWPAVHTEKGVLKKINLSGKAPTAPG